MGKRICRARLPRTRRDRRRRVGRVQRNDVESDEHDHGEADLPGRALVVGVQDRRRLRRRCGDRRDVTARLRRRQADLYDRRLVVGVLDTRYVDFDYNAPLAAGLPVANAKLNVRVLGNANGDTVCYYVELRRKSTNAVVAAYGSSAAPVDCSRRHVRHPLDRTARSGGHRPRERPAHPPLRERVEQPAGQVRPTTVTGTYYGTVFTLHRQTRHGRVHGHAWHGGHLEPRSLGQQRVPERRQLEQRVLHEPLPELRRSRPGTSRPGRRSRASPSTTPTAPRPPATTRAGTSRPTAARPCSARTAAPRPP